jgi:ComF family protein
MKNFKERLFKFLYPDGGLVCLDCDKEIANENLRYFSLCPTCFVNLPLRKGDFCKLCGEPIADVQAQLCKWCMGEFPCYDKVLTPYNYTGIARKMIVNYKENNKTFLYTYIAKHLCNFYASHRVDAHFLACVPSSPKRKSKRGFDHLKKVAEEFVRYERLEIIYPLKKLNEANKPQKQLRRQQRFLNVMGTIKLSDGFDKRKLLGKTVILLDDVVTTTATVNECAKVLKENGAERVFVLALARHFV